MLRQLLYLKEVLSVFLKNENNEISNSVENDFFRCVKLWYLTDIFNYLNGVNTAIQECNEIFFANKIPLLSDKINNKVI